ncbi:MAG: oligopeptidase A [Hahellaceae bacterium]|nr:oligopeptidase A [Hahellaceae bacterium]MCP5210086.1 oligopeptidase A [Hahellaceae bacterium]
MTNPLFSSSLYPAYDQIKVEHIAPAIETMIAENRQQLERLVTLPEMNWQTLALPMEELGERLQNAWSVVSNLNSLMNSDELRVVYNDCVQKITQYHTEIGQNEQLWQAYKTLSLSPGFASANQQQRQAVSHILRDFHLSGVDLEAEKKRQYAELSQKLAEKTNRFSDNVLDATQAWQLHETDDKRLAGLPESALAQAKAAAQAKELEGYLFTLDFPSYYPLITYCDDRDLRFEVYEAYATRASELGPDAGKWDNSTLIEEILQLRYELAQLLGFDNYAERSLAPKMAESVEEVLGFIRELAAKAKPHALREVDELRRFAAEHCAINELEGWDVAYVSEKLKQHSYDISQEALKAYFPLPRVVDGLFTCAKRLFGIDIVKSDAATLWHPDVQFYEIHRDGKQIAAFYFDLYARSKKRGGAWMAGARTRRIKADGELQLPVAYLVCNFTPPGKDNPALLTHNEVTTLFHEFGHGLHHMLTEMDVSEVSGINGVPWDAVELPSQILENWCWQPESLALLAGHYQTGEALPQDMLDRMLAAKNFQAGMMMLRQLEFALFDFRLHSEYKTTNPVKVLDVLKEVRDEVAVFVPPAFNRFSHSFTHIFAGGYAAGYYSYKWAEVLAADAFSSFEENGIFDAATGARFMKTILQQGGSRSPMELFIEFRGRKPSVDALLKQSGLI